MRSRLLATLLLVPALAAFAIAGSTHNFYLSEPTQFSQDLVFPGYDSSDGPLRGVALCLRWKHTRTIDCENLDAQPAIVATAFTPAVIVMQLNGVTLATLNFAPLQRLDTLSAFDGNFDFQGTSAFRTRTSTHGDQLLIFEDPAILAAFIDVPSVTITVQGHDVFSLTGPGNLQSDATTRFQLQGLLVYGGA